MFVFNERCDGEEVLYRIGYIVDLEDGDGDGFRWS